MTRDGTGHCAPQAPASPVKLAVVINCFNYERYVGRAIESVLRQGRDDCDVIVVDDGSTDNSWDVIDAYEVKKHRIPNSKQRSACLFGANCTDAPFILFLDADDELLPHALETIIPKLDPSVAKVQFSMTQIDDEGAVQKQPRIVVSEGRFREELVDGILRTGTYWTPPTSGNVFRRDVLAVMEDAAYDTVIDGVSLYAAPFLGDVVSIAEPLAAYRVHSSNMSSIGRMQSAKDLRLEIKQFRERMQHLAKIVAKYRPGVEMIHPDRMRHTREMEFMLAHALAKENLIPRLPGMYAGIWRESWSLKKKVAMAGFATAVACLPRARSTALISYRYGTGPRDAWGAAAHLLSLTGPPQSQSEPDRSASPP